MEATARLWQVAGFTLLEMLLVSAILVVLATVGIPLMARQFERDRLQLASHRFLVAISLARSEAILRNQYVSICPRGRDDSGRESCGGDYGDGWLVFSNGADDRVIDAADDEILRVFPALPDGYSVANRSGTHSIDKLITYRPDGTAHGNLSMVFCAPGLPAMESLSVVINIVGRARLARGWGKCPAA